MTNPLTDFSDLPLFDRIRPEHVEPAITQLLAEARAAQETVADPAFPADWKAIAKVLDVATERLGVAWGAVGHLKSVADTPELRNAYNAVMPQVSEFWTQMGADERLYAKYKAMDPAALTPEQRQAHKNAIRGFVLSGAELQGEARTRYAQIQDRMAELAQKFSENALDSTDAYAHYAGESEVEGIPGDALEAAAEGAKADGREGYKFTLKLPSYLPVMQYARSSALRETLYRAYATRASELAEGDALSLIHI